jgi:hypothetical protein
MRTLTAHPAGPDLPVQAPTSPAARRTPWGVVTVVAIALLLAGVAVVSAVTASRVPTTAPAPVPPAPARTVVDDLSLRFWAEHPGLAKGQLRLQPRDRHGVTRYH